MPPCCHETPRLLLPRIYGCLTPMIGKAVWTGHVRNDV